MFGVDVKFDKQMAAEEVRQEFGEIQHPMNGHGLNRICFSTLDKKQREVYYYQKVSAILADYGFACTWLLADWRSADFLAVHQKNGTVLKIQLKSGGYEINEKYCKYKDLWMLFLQRRKRGEPEEDWYLIKHHDLVEKARQTTNQLNTKAWKKGKGKGKYVIPRAQPLPEKLQHALRNYTIN